MEPVCRAGSTLNQLLLTPSGEQWIVTLSVIAVLGQAAVLVSSPGPSIYQALAWRQNADWHNNDAAVVTRRSHVHSTEPPGRKTEPWETMKNNDFLNTMLKKKKTQATFLLDHQCYKSTISIFIIPWQCSMLNVF